MGDKARQYRPSHVRRLDTLSGNLCSFPGCERRLVARDGETIVSKICHIEAASEEGPRFNNEMTDDDRRHFNNLVLMCDECHNIIDNKDNEDKYPVDMLHEWKKYHHEAIELLKQPSYSPLSQAINAIASVDLEEDDGCGSGAEIFDIEDKILHNNLSRNIVLINDYKVYYPKVSAIYSELEMQGSFKKERLLRNIRRIYLKVLGLYVGASLNPLSVIKDNADSIFEDVEDRLVETCESSTSVNQDDMSFSLSIIMVDAFMRCKILKEPPKK